MTPHTAEKIYGVILDQKTFGVDQEKTEVRRQEMKQERLRKGRRLALGQADIKVTPTDQKKHLLRLSEYLELVEKKNGTRMICCIKCGNDFCPPGDNYKKYALRWTRDLRELKKVTEAEQPVTHYQEYICPGCGTLLQVDPWCPLIDNDVPLWDIDVKG